MKRVVILNGSPHRDCNTAMLADAFTKGAVAAGHHCERMWVHAHDAHGCMGCDACLRNGGRCVQQDGMESIYEAMYRADVVALASPLYFFGISGQLKVVIDRFYASIKRRFPVTGGVLLLPYGSRDEGETGAAIAHYHAILQGMGWENLGIVTAAGVLQRGDIAGHPALLQAETLGAGL